MSYKLLDQVEDDYSADEMTPEEEVETPVEGDAAPEEDTPAEPEVSEATAMKARMALMEAIVDQVVEDEIDEAKDPDTKEVDDDEDKDDDKEDDEDDDDASEGTSDVDTEKVEETVNNVVDKAVALHFIPSSFKKRIPGIIARHLKVRDPKGQLYAKAALFFTAAMADDSITADGEKDTVAEVLDTGAVKADPIEKTQEFEGDNKQDMSNETEANALDVPKAKARKVSGLEAFLNPFMAGPAVTADAEPDTVSEALETKKDESEPIEVTQEFDGDNKQDMSNETEANALDVPSKAMAHLAASALVKKAATRAVSRKVSGPMLDKLLHELRYQLPAKFVQRYKIR